MSEQHYRWKTGPKSSIGRALKSQCQPLPCFLSRNHYLFCLLIRFHLKRVQQNVPQDRFIWAGTPISQTAWMLAISSVKRADLKPTVFICSAKLYLMTSAGVSSVQAS